MQKRYERINAFEMTSCFPFHYFMKNRLIQWNFAKNNGASLQVNLLTRFLWHSNQILHQILLMNLMLLAIDLEKIVITNTFHDFIIFFSIVLIHKSIFSEFLIFLRHTILLLSLTNIEIASFGSNFTAFDTMNFVSTIAIALFARPTSSKYCLIVTIAKYL